MKTSVSASLAAVAAVMLAAPAAGADDVQTGWAAWFNSVKVDDQCSIIADVQLRSSDDWQHMRSVVARVGATRVWRPGITVGAGAAYIETVNIGASNLSERRLWQQVVFQKSFDARSLTQRVRLEQRFLELASGDDAYSTRLRYSARLVVPLGTADRSAPGNYLALQNEAMFHISGEDRLNGRLFDQNRAYVGFGRRLGKQLDLEIGYLNQYVVGRSRDTSNHALQSSVYTRW